MSEIKFGTDGWRAITDKDFNDENVTRATKQLQNTLLIISEQKKKF